MWLPHLPTDGTPIFQQILASLERGISDGVLKAGERLPPQRALAYKLGVSVGTVTRAYEEADRRGLTVGHVGRGTFIARAYEMDSVRAPGQWVDFSMNLPPMVAAERLLAEIWGKVRRRHDFLDVLHYGPVEGLPQHRRLAVAWLSRTASVESVDPARVVITAGGQASMDLVFTHLCRPGDTILAEELTFSGMKAAARHRGFLLAGVAMDDEGILPDSLTAQAKASGARVLYTMPTLQNPTGRCMSLSRRKDVIKVARKLKLCIVEDDNYAVYMDRRAAPPPFVNLAPDITYHVSGLSKSLAPGLRTGFVLAPTATGAVDIAQGVRASLFTTQSLGMLLAQQAIEDGAADQIVKENLRILRTRGELLREALGITGQKQVAASPHIWLTLTAAEAERIESQLLCENIRVTGHSVPLLAGAHEFGLRFCSAATRRDADFDRGLAAIRRVMARPTDYALRAVV